MQERRPRDFGGDTTGLTELEPWPRKSEVAMTILVRYSTITRLVVGGMTPSDANFSEEYIGLMESLRNENGFRIEIIPL